MLRKLTVEALGVLLWTYLTLSMYRQDTLGRLNSNLSLAIGLVGFLMIVIFYSIGYKISGAHFNPLISLGHYLLSDLNLSEVAS